MEKINHRKLRSTLGSRVSRRVGTKSRKQSKESVKIQMKRLVKAAYAEKAKVAFESILINGVIEAKLTP